MTEEEKKPEQHFGDLLVQYWKRSFVLLNRRFGFEGVDGRRVKLHYRDRVRLIAGTDSIKKSELK